MALPARRIIVPLLLAVGAITYAILISLGNRPILYIIEILLVSLAAGLALSPDLRQRVIEAMDRIRHPSPRSLRLATAGILLGSAVYITLTAWQQGRDFYPSMHDEHSYLLQMRMLAEGRLWMPEHPLADFFESFHILVRPVYTSIYFPGTAVMYAPGLWLGLPWWVLPALAAGGVAALTYRITTELIDGAAGALAVLLLLGIQEFRVYGLAIMSQTPAALLGLMIVWLWLQWRRWRRDRNSGWTWCWVAGIGIAAGWAAVTRPVDALAFALPVGLAMLWEMRREGILRIAAAGSLLALGALPFFGLQAVFNKGVTGSWTKTPYVTYLEQSQPQTAYGFHDVDAAAEPQTQLLQKRLYYDDWMIPAIRAHNQRPMLQTLFQYRLPQLLQVLLPGSIMAILLLPGLLGLNEPRRWVFWSAMPLFVGFYLLNTFFLSHYLVPLAAVMIFSVLMGARTIEAHFGATDQKLPAFLILAVALIGLSRLPQVNPLVHDGYGTPTVQFVNEFLPELVERPAVVLWNFTPESSYHDEPVYNSGVTWPDDAAIIHAHHLGERNDELIDYYGRHQPRRHVYVIHRAEGEMTYLGRAGDLRWQQQENAGSARYSPQDR